MSNQRIIPKDTTSNHGYIDFKILLDGQEANATYQIFSIVISKEVNRIPSAKILIRDGSAAAEDFEISNTDDFIPGKAIEIKAGHDGINSTLFKGIIVKHGIKVREQGTSELMIEAKDESVKMTIGRHNKYYENEKDSAVIETLLGQYGLQPEVEDTTVKHKEIVKYQATDWDFMLARAEVNGKLVFVSDGVVEVKAPNTGTASVLQLIYGSTIIDFEAEIDARTQWKSVKSYGWNFSDQALLNAESTSADFEEEGNLDGATLADTIGLEEFELRHSGQVLQEELQAWAEACMLKSRLAKIRGRAKFTGFAEVKCGSVVELQGVGDRFNGKVFVTGVRHELINGSWFTHIQFGLDPKWFTQQEDVSDIAAAGLLPAVNGLQIGKVVQLENDPVGEDRILVKLPILDNDAQGIWTRLASLDAGENRGWVIRPEIDDEVVVGFINDDPRDAIVLGMLHSKAKPAPTDIAAADDNHIKGYVSRSEMKVLFDDENKIITIETPAGNSIVITEQDTAIKITDQNNNKITMDSSGIALESPFDIKLEATGNIEIKATGNLKMEGMMVEGKAQTQLKMEGTAAAELSCGGPTTVKGTPLMLN